MKTYRRLEITAFRRRVTIISGALSDKEQTGEGVRISNADMLEAIEPDSAEGREILLEALRILEEELARERRKTNK